MTQEEESWVEYRRLVMSELDRLDGSVIGLGKKLDDFRDEMMKELTALKIRSAMWGAVAGSVPVGLAIIYQVLKDA